MCSKACVVSQSVVNVVTRPEVNGNIKEGCNGFRGNLERVRILNAEFLRPAKEGKLIWICKGNDCNFEKKHSAKLGSC